MKPWPNNSLEPSAVDGGSSAVRLTPLVGGGSFPGR
jgi:hypothetical protein